MIIFRQCDLLSISVDAIVCSSNNWLKMGTGNAKRIKMLRGDSIEQECAKYIKQNGPVPIGDAIVTGPGNLVSNKQSQRYIIHAIGVGYQHYINGQVSGRILATYTTVKSAVLMALSLAEELNIKTIAFPLMCARAGYSIYSPREAPYRMLVAMLDGIQYHTYVTLEEVDLCMENMKLIEYGQDYLSKINA